MTSLEYQRLCNINDDLVAMIDRLQQELSKQKILVTNLEIDYVNLENKYNYDIGIERKKINEWRDLVINLKQKIAEKDSLIQRLIDGKFKEINELQEQLKMHQDADKIRSWPPINTQCIHKIGTELTYSINQQKVQEQNIRMKAVEYAIKHLDNDKYRDQDYVLTSSKKIEAYIKDGK